MYPYACLVQLPKEIKVFPVFYNSLLRASPKTEGLPSQDRINKAESKNIRGRILEREDGSDEVVVKWEFENILDCHNEDSLHQIEAP